MPDPVAAVARAAQPAVEAPGEPPAGRPDPALRQAARRFEAVFLAEMLKHAGLAKPPEQFGGGAGETQFAPFLVREYAEALAARGGIGLADRIGAALAASARPGQGAE
ncbi:hypothetical protein LNKW23_28480 [Paralimibaculum aggregatum]|uniref:Flagellar protein FlgJ N-terminal domain-containing protein n=1 Tax=Paralimibaculum aggregatum TaxID=3036245 RepID=A0ABQ6LRE5_9RHOB|nr:rod-binding protein [Limibaculum sp. NKW23]GMG83635.1 hypothetical protein LNKW23_28480 [Limibaculum sp. NKW23]